MPEMQGDPMLVVERLLAATNAHDVERIAACFAEDYTLESPLHPARSFRGRQQVRSNWTQIFAAVRDLEARIIASAHNGQMLWTEWEMLGTRPDRSPHCMRGVFIFCVSSELIVSGRMFFEPVDASKDDAIAGLRRVLEGKPA